MADSDRSDDQAVTAAQEVVHAHAEEAERIALLRRRFVRALHDLGWRHVVGDDWIRIGSGGVEFGPLTFDRADRLLRDCEDIARRATLPAPRPTIAIYLSNDDEQAQLN